MIEGQSYVKANTSLRAKVRNSLAFLAREGGHSSLYSPPPLLLLPNSTPLSFLPTTTFGSLSKMARYHNQVSTDNFRQSWIS
jgi:hypothetical protein